MTNNDITALPNTVGAGAARLIHSRDEARRELQRWDARVADLTVEVGRLVEELDGARVAGQLVTGEAWSFPGEDPVFGTSLQRELADARAQLSGACWNVQQAERELGEAQDEVRLHVHASERRQGGPVERSRHAQPRDARDRGTGGVDLDARSAPDVSSKVDDHVVSRWPEHRTDVGSRCPWSHVLHAPGAGRCPAHCANSQP